MLENIEDERLRKQLKFFFRFLKENGIYSAYRKYINNPKTYNGYQKTHKKWTLEKCAAENGVGMLITMLISWSNTKEGYNFWCQKHIKFGQKFNKKFRNA